MSTDYTPEIGEPDPDALEWINSMWDRIPWGARFRRPGLPARGLKEFIRENAEGIRLQAPFRATVIAAVEQATGARYIPPSRRCACGAELDAAARLFGAGERCSTCAAAAKREGEPCR